MALMEGCLGGLNRPTIFNILRTGWGLICITILVVHWPVENWTWGGRPVVFYIEIACQDASEGMPEIPDLQIYVGAHTSDGI